MILGLNPGAWLFWANLLSIAVVAGIAIVRRRMILISGIALTFHIFVTAMLWSMQGACVLPQPSTIEYRPGMTLCPGQATKFNIVIPKPSTGA